MKPKLTFIAALLILGVLLAGCSSEPPVREVTLVAEDIEWSQTLIEANVGDTLQLTIRNDGALDHDFVLKEFDLDILLSPGQQQTVTLVLDQAGEFQYICNIPGHLDAGMEGVIVVSE